MVKYLIVMVLVGVQTKWLVQAQAEALRDPTMPPSQLGLMQADAMPVEKPKPVLQSVALGTTHKSAMISGQTVLLGQQFEGLTLVKLTATEAVLQAKNGHFEVLKMEYPVQKKTLDVAIQPDTKAKRHAVLHLANENK